LNFRKGRGRTSIRYQAFRRRLGLAYATYIDLADVSWAQGQMFASFSGDA